MVTNKMNLENFEVVELTETYNLFMMSKILTMLKGPMSFTLTMKIGKNKLVHDLSDLGKV